MRRLITALFVTLCLPVCVYAGNEDAVRTFLESQLDESKAPSISVAVGVRGEIALAVAVGVADEEGHLAATPETRYRTYSITKAITAVALMQLVQSGGLSLDDEIRAYVPTFPASQPPILLRHLATHTSGIRHYKEGAGEISSTRQYDSLADAITIFKDDPLAFTPGTDYLYSSFGFSLLLGAIEKSSGMSYAQYLQQEVFAPAGMSHSSVEVTGTDVTDLAQPYYVRSWLGLFHTLKHIESRPNLSSRIASASVVSTPSDLVRLVMALEDSVVLQPETVQRMFAVPFPHVREDQAIGWNVTMEEGRKVVYRFGGGMGYTGLLLYYPDQAVAGALLVNLAEFENRVSVLETVLKPFLTR